MWNKTKSIKRISYILAITAILCGVTGSAYADTQGQKSIGDIGVDITWYDFGKDFTNYRIQHDYGVDIYKLELSGNSDEKAKTAFVNGKGEILLNPETYDGGSSWMSGGEAGTLMKRADKNQYLCIDSTGIKEINGNDYSSIGSFLDGYATVTLKSNAHKGVIDKTGKLIFEDKEGKYDEFSCATYSTEKVIRVSKGEKYGFIDLSGAEIIPLIYEYAAPFHEGLAAVSKGKKWGFIDKTGKEVISFTFDGANSFHNGLAMVSVHNKWGAIDKAGNIVIPLAYDRIVENEQGLLDVEKDNQSFIINYSGEVVSKDEKLFTGLKDFTMIYLSDDLYLGGKFGEYPPGIVPPHDYNQRFALLDSKGNNLTGFKYSNTGEFFHNFKVFYKEYYEGAGLVNQHGAEVLPTIFENILLTEEGYAFVSIRDPETGANGRVGYFKIPESFSDKKGVKPITVYLDGMELYFDSEPIIKDQRTMVPMRKIFESLGADVNWDNKTKMATATTKDKVVSISIGSKEASVNGVKIQLETAPFIKNDSTLVPLRFVSENLGADVKWDGEAQRVVITSHN